VRVAVTASLGRLESLEARLLEAGFDAVRVPLVAVAPLPGVAATAGALLGLPWRLYPSRSAVEAWTQLGLGFADSARIGAIGPGTAAELARSGARVDATAEPATAEGLARTLLAHHAAPRVGDAVGVVQGDRARPHLAHALRAAGLDVRTATLYASRGVGWSLDGAVDAVVVASPSAVAALPPAVAARALLVAIGPTTAAAVARRGWTGLAADAPTTAGVVAALERWRAERPGPRLAEPPTADPGGAR